MKQMMKHFAVIAAFAAETVAGSEIAKSLEDLTARVVVAG
jgi:hypothetical protein